MPATPPPERPTSTPALTALLDHADELWQTARDAGLAHAHARIRIAASLLRTRWPTVGAVDADLSRCIASDGHPEVWAVLDSDGHRLWSREPRRLRDDVIGEAESALGLALAFADHIRVGWAPMTVLGFGIHRLTLPPGTAQEAPACGDGTPTDAAEPLPWKSTRRPEGGWPWRPRRD